MSRAKLLLHFFPQLLVVLSCTTTTENPHHSPPALTSILAETKIPPLFAATNPLPLNSVFLIPDHLLDLAIVNRTSAEVRQGPGTIYALNDRILTKETEIICLVEMDVWKKVRVLNENIEGWVHKQTLAPLASRGVSIEIDIARLPQVFATKDTRFGYNYVTYKKESLTVPSGSFFPVLKSTSKKYLVVIRETNSVIWLPKGSVQ